MLISRRDFSSLALAALAGVKLSPAAGKRRLACNSWPFRGYFDTPEMHRYRDPRFPLLHLEQFPEFLADHFGIHQVEFLPQHFRATTAAYVGRVLAGVRRARSRVVNLMGVEIPGGLYNPRLDPAAAMRAARLWIDIAVRLGSPSATFPLSGPRPYRPAIAARNLRPIAAYARSRGIRVLFHNDDIHAESADKILAVLRALQAPNAGTCPDFGNFAVRSSAYALWTLRRLMPHAVNICHAKDGIAPDGRHFYADNFPMSMAVARRDHFSGAYSLEFEGVGDPVPGVRALMEKTLARL